MIQIQNITKSFGEVTLYKNLSLFIQEGERVALLARNGAGKSSLLDIVAGVSTPDSGEVTMRNGVRVGYLLQTPQFDSCSSVIDTIYASSPQLRTALDEYHAATHSGNEERLSHAIEVIDSLDGWDIEQRAKVILSKLNITNVEQEVTTMSGGELRRVALAQTLVSNPDFLILDEPTNHLDLEMSAWLEEYLLKCGKTILLVTHDRYFLDRVCTNIYEIDQGEIFSYKGGYSDYIARRAERIEQESSERERAHNLYRREAEWMRRMPKARGTKAKYRKDAFEDIKQRAFSSRDEKSVSIGMGSQRLGKKVLEVKALSKSFGEKCVLHNFDYTFNRGEKLGIIGENGAGKSTLLKMLTGAIPADSGIVDTGSSVKVGYYRQEGISFDEGSRVIDVAREVAEVVTMSDGSTISVSQLLQQFNFDPPSQYSFVSKLSGGERRRLYLLTILMRSPNLLILDEPTNDLDITTLNVLESYLENFAGSLLVVSHDRYFMDKVVDHLLIFEDRGRTKLFEGNYTQYRNSLEIEQELQREVKAASTNAASTSSVTKPKFNTNSKPKLSYKEQRELEALEIEIGELESEKSSIEEYLSSGTLDSAELTTLSERHLAISETLDEKSMRWLTLEEIKGGL